MSETSETSVVIVYHSGYGHTESIANTVAKGVQSVEGVKVTMIKADDQDKDWDVLAAADAIVFGSPTYMGSVSGQFKMFMDESSKVWFTQGWKDKVAAGFTVSSSQSGDKLNTLTQLQIFAGQHSMIWVPLGMLPGNNSSTASIEDLNRLGAATGLMAQANADEGPDVAPQSTDHRTAEKFGANVAASAKRWASAA
ncbi:Multimeric flavodoxin WrbA [Cohaesibacter sp. ES.047]|uniref:flavodoxin family protein n=1 Tax=Cohaesibacter sp. ES.047 TaxID=1798205 RepID=UPI000BB8BBBB|nr:flavodoxin family protein [Cohaesibacter sp. ES.047]SNY92597.1 Multimeric flavodoxin WrbA [Cohaesibacter sp. ES.047]